MTKLSVLARLAPLGLLALLGTGCDAYYAEFYDQTLGGAGTLRETSSTTFDSTLPSSVSEVFATCHDPLTLSPSDPFDPGGTCDALGDLSTTGAQIVWAGLNTMPVVDIGAAFPDDLEELLDTRTTVVDPLDWPAQNCDFIIDLDMSLTGFELLAGNVAWVTHDGKPAFTMDFNSTGAPLAAGSLDGDAECPSFINEWILQPHLPQGHHEIDMTGFDLDVWWSFSFAGADVTAAVAVEMDSQALTITPALDEKLGEFEDLLADLGVTRAQIEREVEKALRDQLAAVGDQLAAMIESAVPAGHKICTLAVTASGLKLTTAKGMCPIPLSL